MKSYLSHFEPSRWRSVQERSDLLANGSKSSYSSIERRRRGAISRAVTTYGLAFPGTILITEIVGGC